MPYAPYLSCDHHEAPIYTKREPASELLSPAALGSVRNHLKLI
ncbi:hypothetical protein PS639_04400 [Pseudomonas fluorescens]|nr:hypothetical protein PS639_04400 [Pseudomonas fluorescens]